MPTPPLSREFRRASAPPLPAVIAAALLLCCYVPSVAAKTTSAIGFLVPPTVPRAQRHEFRHEIEQMEDAWRTAILKGNATALDGLLADDYTGITAKGAIQTKEQALNSIRTGALQISVLNISDRKIRIYGATAVVTSVAELTGARKEMELTGRYRYTRVYVRKPTSQWKIVSFEASRIQDGPERR